MRFVFRNRRFKLALPLLVGLAATFTFTLAPQQDVFAADNELAAVFKKGVLEVNIPYDDALAGKGSLSIEVLDPADKPISKLVKSVTKSGTIQSWRFSLPVDRAVRLEDLAWDRLRINEGDDSRTVSISEILRIPVVKFFGQSSYEAGSTASARVITVDSKTSSPLRGSVIKLELISGSESTTLFTGRTDSFGTAQVSFSVPALTFGSHQIRITADTTLGTVVADQPVQLERRARILLTTDKPLYQPGQTMHLRALAFDNASRAAAADQPITLEVEDGKGNKVFKKRGRTDRFGVAFSDFELADEVNFGAYHIRAILGDQEAQVSQEKTVTVDRYVLPKFKVEIELGNDAAKKQTGYYSPGETVSGKVTARYMFGKPIANANVALTLTAFDVQTAEIGRVNGKTDDTGSFEFSTKLPDFFAGRSTNQGSAPVSISAEVKDSAQHSETKSRDIIVSKTPIMILAVPESGTLLPGLDNRVYILTSYPGGGPACTTITGNFPGGKTATDESGVAVITIHADDHPANLDLKATDDRGKTAQANLRLDSTPRAQNLMLRTDRAIYKVGDTVKLQTFSTRQRGPVYVDVVKNGQTQITRAIETSGGRGELSLDLTAGMFGTLEVRAYQITADADPILDRRLIYVDPADDLKVEVSAERDTYKPGEEASINFRVTDRAGRPVSAALGIEIVDEAVFALSDRHPGFEKVFLYLEKELLTPRYEIHQFTFDKVMIDDFDGEKPQAQAARERAARVLLAAAGTVAGRDVRAQFGREAIDSKRDDYLSLYSQTVFERAQKLASALTAYYRRRASSPDGFARDLHDFSVEEASQRKLLEDPWGNPITGDGKIVDAGASYLVFRSAGPDGRFGTSDDIEVPGYAQRDPGARMTGEFRGHVSLSRGVIPGGRAGITGVVKDDKGNPIVGAVISAQRLSSGSTAHAYADSQGQFAIANLSPGNYRLGFEHEGYRSTSYRTLALEAGSRATVDSALESRGASPVTVAVYMNRRMRFEGDFARKKDGDREMLQLQAREVGRSPARAGQGVAPEPPKAGPASRDDKPINGRGFELEGAAAAEAGAEPRVRSFFPETLYTNPNLITDGQGRASIRVPLADSITTWRITSLASTVRGAIGSATAPVKVFQDFFIDLDLPTSITEGDAVSVPVAVYNYLDSQQRVSLEIKQDPWFTLDGDTPSRQIDVKPGEVTVAYFRIKATKIGEQPLQVNARLNAAPADQPGDAISRTINVLPNGEEHAIVINERLEGAVTKQVTIPPDSIADASKILVKLYPGALSQVVEGLDSILRMPGGCFEQTSSSTYPDVLVMDYMKTSKKLTPEVQAKAEGYISLGYQRLVTFEVKGGGFSWFGEAPANKILTAYGLMEFSDMSRIHEVDPRLIQRTQAWLAGQQQPDGSFKPDTSFINEGATTHYNSDVLRITAYIGWSLASSGYQGEALERAKQFVASHLTGKEDAYTVAVVSNFATDFGKDKAWIDQSINALAAKAVESATTAYWKQDGETPTSAKNDSADLETTAMAAQALLKSGQKSGLAKKALDYLTQKKDAFGNWQTTQATILALRAFLLSFTRGTNADTAGTVAVTVDGKQVERIQIDRDSNDLLRVLDLKAYTHQGAHQVGLTFEGRGSMQYQIVGRYYTPWIRRAGPGPQEPLSIDVSYDRTRLAQDETATAKVRVQNNTAATAKMIMVDLGIPPGFEPSGDDFESLVDSSKGKSGGRLEKFTITAKQVILYFDGLNPRQRVEFSFKLRAKFPVRAQTFSSRVYEYYNPSIENKTRPVEMVVASK